MNTPRGILRSIASIGSDWPLYEIDQEGSPSSVGRLHALTSGQWLFTQDVPWDTAQGDELPDGLHLGLPWFLHDLRPQGFLGHIFGRGHGQVLGLPVDPRQWSDDDVVTLLIRHGHDLPGSFILGEDMLERFQKNLCGDSGAISASSRVEVYPALADSVLNGTCPSSLAGGEQPKFTAAIIDDDGAVRHVVVKFSGCAGSPKDRRWADLLAAEHVAGCVLAENGIPAARTEIVDAGGRRFLESERFDRVGAGGRRGVVSLAAVDSEYFGQIDTPWTAAADRLYGDGWMTKEDASRLTLLWWFGKMIGNTDMHYGNASLFFRKDRPLALAPSYDMLPMLYHPDHHGTTPAHALEIPPPIPEAEGHWRTASAMAETFWSKVAALPSVSKEFRLIAEGNATIVAQNRKRFAP